MLRIKKIPELSEKELKRFEKKFERGNIGFGYLH